jgi:hypothetical protein
MRAVRPVRSLQRRPIDREARRRHENARPQARPRQLPEGALAQHPRPLQGALRRRQPPLMICERRQKPLQFLKRFIGARASRPCPPAGLRRRGWLLGLLEPRQRGPQRIEPRSVWEPIAFNHATEGRDNRGQLVVVERDRRHLPAISPVQAQQSARRPPILRLEIAF